MNARGSSVRRGRSGNAAGAGFSGEKRTGSGRPDDGRSGEKRSGEKRSVGALGAPSAAGAPETGHVFRITGTPGSGRAPEGRHYGRVLGQKKGFGVIDCRSCGFIHLDPLPGDEELERVYREEYFTGEKPDFMERVQEDEEWWNAVFDRRLSFMESSLAPGQRSIIDIGCGPGHFLQRAARRGWRCLGVEPSPVAAEAARQRGVEVIEGFFEGAATGAVSREGRGFDAAHISEVIEHVRDPFQVLSGVFELLGPGGIACVVAPNDFSPVQETLAEGQGFDDYWVAPPHHVNYFSFHTLASLMERAGFSIIRTTATFPMDFFLLMGENYVGDDELGRRCHRMRMRLDLMLDTPRLRGFRDEMYGLMARHSIGREAVVFGIKEG